MESRLGPRRSTDREGSHRLVHTFPAAYSPKGEGDARLFEHLEFALRYEGVDLAALSAVFARIEPGRFARWIDSHPTGKYARRAGFLYEWLTRSELPIDEARIAGAYAPVLDGHLHFTGPPVSSARWHVHDNLPGTAEWCPTIHRSTLDGVPIGAIDISAALRNARDQVPPEVFERAISYAYLAETQASYAIEHDAPTPTQRHAFLRALQSAGDLPSAERLAPERLTELQALIFSGVPTFITPGVRTDDGFVGSALRLGLRRIDYPCPPAREVDALLRGLRRAAESRLAVPEIPPSVFAGALAFGFVFVHPLQDGNGRVHRFLIHETLIERGAVERGAVIPVSATMLATIREYDVALRAYSQPVRVAAQELAGVPFALESTEPFSFHGYDSVAPLYRYPVLTDQVAYLERAIQQSIDESLLDESLFLMKFDRARERVNERMNLEAGRTDLLIQLIHQNGGALSKTKRRAHFADLSDEVITEAEDAVRSAFAAS